MIELAALTFLLLGLFAIVTVAFALLKVVLWAVLIPVRLLLHVLLLPLLLLKALLGGIALVFAGPILLIALAGGLAIAAAVMVTPLLPVLLIGFVIWLVLRATERPAVVR